MSDQTTDSDDLPARLRFVSTAMDSPPPVLKEAADEIERLRARVTELEEEVCELERQLDAGDPEAFYA
jgi:hypothetical protein